MILYTGFFSVPILALIYFSSYRSSSLSFLSWSILFCPAIFTLKPWHFRCDFQSFFCLCICLLDKRETDWWMLRSSSLTTNVSWCCYSGINLLLMEDLSSLWASMLFICSSHLWVACRAYCHKSYLLNFGSSTFFGVWNTIFSWY